MGNSRNTGYLQNTIKVSDTGAITFVSGSTTLMSISNTGAVSSSATTVSSSVDNLVVNNNAVLGSSESSTVSIPAFIASDLYPIADTYKLGSPANYWTTAYVQTGSFNEVNVTGKITAQTLVVQTITSSVDFVTGSTQFGSLLSNTHVFSGSVTMNPNGLFVSSSGNVGIGITNPSYKLHISGAFSSNPGLYVYGTTYGMVGVDRGSSASSAGINYYSVGSQRWFAGIYENTNNFGFYNATTATFPLVITSGNNVGIGTSSPLNLTNYTTLEVKGTNAGVLAVSSEAGSSFGRIYNTGTLVYVGTSTNHPLIFDTNDAEKMRITSGGNVGIGKTNPEGPLHINGAIGAGYIGMAISNYANNIGTTSGIDFGTDMSTCYNGSGNGQIAVTNMDGTTMKSEMNLKIWNGSALVTGIKISDAGKVSFPTATAQNYGLSNASAITVNNGTSNTVASCTLTTTGKPVFVNLTGDINPVGGSSYCYIYITRDGTPIGKYIIAESPGSSTNIPFALTTIDIPSAASHTYAAYVTVSGAYPIQFGETGNGQAPTILAIELL